MTAEQEQDCLDYAAGLIAEFKDRCMLKTGRGVTVLPDGHEGQIVALDGLRDGFEQEDKVIPQRDSESLLAEKIGQRIYCNFPPVNGVMATIDGVSIFADETPYFEVPDGAWGIYAKVAYTRAEVAIPSDPPADHRRPGLTVSGVAVTLDLYASPPTNVVPVDPGGESVEPFAGAYERYYHVADITDGVLTLAVAPFPDSSYYGGFSITSNGVFDGVDLWTWSDGTAAP